MVSRCHLVCFDRSLRVCAERKNRGWRVFGGGYFNSGFQSFKLLNPTTGAQVGTFKPVNEANSGIFGVRSSYNFRPQMAAEATFGFSPAGRSQNVSTSGFLTGVLTPTQIQPVGIPFAVRSPV